MMFVNSLFLSRYPHSPPLVSLPDAVMVLRKGSRVFSGTESWSQAEWGQFLARRRYKARAYPVSPLSYASISALRKSTDRSVSDSYGAQLSLEELEFLTKPRTILGANASLTSCEFIDMHQESGTPGPVFGTVDRFSSGKVIASRINPVDNGAETTIQLYNSDQGRWMAKMMESGALREVSISHIRFMNQICVNELSGVFVGGRGEKQTPLLEIYDEEDGANIVPLQPPSEPFKNHWTVELMIQNR